MTSLALGVLAACLLVGLAVCIYAGMALREYDAPAPGVKRRAA
jgi:hypothetical protein